MDALSGARSQLSSQYLSLSVEIAAPSQGIPTSPTVLSNVILTKDLVQTPTMDSNPPIHPYKIHGHPCHPFPTLFMCPYRTVQNMTAR